MKVLWTVLVVIAVMLLYLTCPDMEEHQKAVDDRYKALTADMTPSNAGLAGLFLVGAKTAGKLEVRVYEDWWLFSTANFFDDMTTFGILNHVFIFGSQAEEHKSRKRKIKEVIKNIPWWGWILIGIGAFVIISWISDELGLLD